MKKPLLYIEPAFRFLTFWLVCMSVSLLASAQVKFGNSYVNVTKKTIGGTVEPGDVLEIRTNIYFPGNYNGSNYIVYSARYIDNVPSNTIFSDDSLRLITNEGLTYKKWTLAADTDPGRYNASPGAGQYNIKINLGNGATAPTNTSNDAAGAGNIYTGAAGGRVQDKPRANGGVLVTASFRVTVTGNIGDTITLGAGQIRYKLTAGGSDQIQNSIRYKILISTNDPICANSVGKNFVNEAGGTFDSGYVQSRTTAPVFNIPNYLYRPYSPPTLPLAALNDGSYAILNNISPWGSTNANAQIRPNCPTSTSGNPPASASCANRMFSGYWDIMGDHTGSTTSAGNAPTAPGSEGGYMLVVNADYATSEAYRQNITGLCPNTSYEFSLWVKNICRVCGADSSGNATFKPGVLPNLAFAIDGLDRYSTGQIDTLGWQKKGFLFRTGPTQSTITISIRNNASGGGGNDWAIDDIALVSCNPELTMVPSNNSQICIGSQMDINTTVTSFFRNYNHYRWEKSTDGGVSWTVPASGEATPDMSGTYVAYMVPASKIADSSDHLSQYRFTVASTAQNLDDPECSFQDTARLIIMVNNCNNVLESNAVKLSGRLAGKHAQLEWTVRNEAANTTYEIERSDNGRLFYRVGRISGAGATNSSRTYTFTDLGALTQPAQYRVKIIEGEQQVYTRTIVISNMPEPGIRSLVNPFNDKISFDLEAIENAPAVVSLFDNYGKLIRKLNMKVTRGITPIVIDGLSALSKGAYVLRVEVNQKIINKMMLKTK